MTADRWAEKANNITNHVALCLDFGHDLDPDSLHRAIATALREAFNAGLERAAVEAEDEEHDPDWNAVIAGRIRALKEPAP